LLKPSLGITGISMMFKAPVISDNAEIAAALSPYIEAGAASPNMLVDALGDLLGKTFEPFDGEWADKPLVLAMQEMSAGGADAPPTAPVGIEKSAEVSDIIETLKDLQSVVKAAVEL
jgi:capsid portal protein